MGECCSKSGVYIAPEEKEEMITFRNYSSNFDHYYKKIEGQYNYLKFVQIYEYLLLLSTFHKGKLSAGQHRGHNEEIDKNNFCVYIDNKLLKNHLIYDSIVNDERSANIFRDYLQGMYDTLSKSYIDLLKKKNPEKKIKKSEVHTLKKLHLISIGLLNCNSDNKVKINFVFNLFSNERNLFANSEDLLDFLYFLFITPSTASLRVLKDLGEKYDNLNKIENEDYMKVMDSFEIKDILRARDLFINQFFKGKEELHIGEFTERFLKEDFGWIFSADGIREFLQKNNDTETATQAH